MATIQPPNWPFSFQGPDEWEVRQPPVKDAAHIFFRGPFLPEAPMAPAITVEARPATVSSLDKLAQEWVTRRTLIRTFHVLARRETNLAGIEAVQIDGAYDMPVPIHSQDAKMVPIRERVILALSSDKVYEITYRTAQDDFNKFLGVFEDLAASFSL